MNLDDLQTRLDNFRLRISSSVDWRKPYKRLNADEEGQATRQQNIEGTDDLFKTTRLHVVGWGIVVVFIFGGISWASATRIDGAAIALGIVGVESNRKSVAHLEGGIVREILVKEGDQVTKNQTLIRMDKTRSRASLDLLQGRMDTLDSRKARLDAERRGLATIEFPPELLDRAHQGKLLDIMDGEMQVLDTRRRNLDRKDSILKERIQKQRANIRGSSGKRVASQKGIKLLKEEFEMMSGLLKEGLVAKNRVLSVERKIVDSQGDIHDLTSRIAQAGDEIAKLEMERAQILEQHQQDIAMKHQETNERIAEVAEKIRAAKDILRRTDVIAPGDGVVVALRQHTIGGVIQAGEPVLELIPDHDRYVIDLRIDPNDIDIVYPGQTARVRLSAFNARTTPMIVGEVIHVSADRLTDPATGVGYFAGRVIPNTLSMQDDMPTLSPGMQAEVYLVTGERTVLDFLLDPLVRATERAGREL